jgi:hypothetical protein
MDGVFFAEDSKNPDLAYVLICLPKFENDQETISPDLLVIATWKKETIGDIVYYQGYKITS